MALINCLECGQRISDKAKNCPKCGCKVTDSSVDFYGNKIESKETVNNPFQENTNISKQKNYSYKSKSSKTYGSIKPGLIKAYKLRQQDDGWGYAFAHMIPLVWIHYAISRKTITPFLYQAILSILLAILVGNYYIIFWFILTPINCKFAISNAREYAKQKLKENGISEDDSSNDFITQKFCRNCGAAMNMNDIFCRSCGHKN
tara:strand:+ start:185 stop:793 length:609 start_codon:yes stop_codon:yes gene_type:complete